MHRNGPETRGGHGGSQTEPDHEAREIGAFRRKARIDSAEESVTC